MIICNNNNNYYYFININDLSAHAFAYSFTILGSPQLTAVLVLMFYLDYDPCG